MDEGLDGSHTKLIGLQSGAAVDDEIFPLRWVVFGC